MDSLVIHNFTIDYYIDRLKNNRYFSLAGYSDAEWYSILGKRLGTTTGLGQMLDGGHGDKLADVLRRRQHDLRFLFSIPSCLWDLPLLCHYEINNFLLKEGIEIEAFERDIILDDLARDAGLFPFIQQLQKMNVVVVGNKHLRGLDFLNYKYFVEISSPNLHLDESELKTAINDAVNYPGTLKGNSCVFLVSAGVSAAIIVDKLHGAIPNSFFIDCGSIWDAFVGIGGQREWRANLYSNPEKWKDWIRSNLYGEEKN